MKKFSKKSMLSFLTVSAIVVTTVGSFAVWDKLNDTSITASATLSPIRVTATQNVALTASERTADNYTNESYVPVYTSEPIKFTVTGIENNKQQLKLTPTVKVDGKEDISNFTVTVKEEGTPVVDGVDKDLATTTYTVEVTPSADGQNNADALSGKQLTVELKGEIQQQTVAP